MNKILVALSLSVAAFAARADSVATLKDFIRDVKTGRAQFTQTVTSPDGAKKKTSTGSFEFSRPNRFRFVYAKPFEQQIVADGQKVWIYDADLNQASSRKFNSALGATPAALLAGGSLDKDFELAALPAKDGLEWVSATPKAKDGAFKSVRVGFRGKISPRSRSSMRSTSARCCSSASSRPAWRCRPRPFSSSPRPAPM